MIISLICASAWCLNQTLIAATAAIDIATVSTVDEAEAWLLQSPRRDVESAEQSESSTPSGLRKESSQRSSYSRVQEVPDEQPVGKTNLHQQRAKNMKGFHAGDGSPRADGPVKGPLVPQERSTDGVDALSSPAVNFTSRNSRRGPQILSGATDTEDLRATKDMCVWAFEVLEAHLNGTDSPGPPPSVTALQRRKISCPLFVTWEKRSASKGRSANTTWEKRSTGRGRLTNGDSEEYKLRGCIGSLSAVPVEKISQYALRSAFEDSRFEPIATEEIPHLRVKISLLLHYERVESWDDWEIGKHGVIVKFRDPNGEKREATYLPEVALDHGFDHFQSVRSLIVKAGYSHPERIDFKTIEVTRYQSSKVALPYAEYLQLRQRH